MDILFVKMQFLFVFMLVLVLNTNCHGILRQIPPSVPSFSKGHNNGKVDSKSIDEASGLAASQVYPGILYTHNDHGDRPRIFAIRVSDANVVATLDISYATNHDWEDIAVGPCGRNSNKSCIFIGDIGSGDHGHAANIIYRVQEPASLVDQALPLDSQVIFSWSEQESDTLMVDPNGQAYVISKVLGGRGIIAQIPESAWGHLTPVSITSTAFLNVPNPSSHHDPLAGDISPDGTQVLVKTHEKMYYWKVTNGDYLGTLGTPGQEVPFHKEHHSHGGLNVVAAVCWSYDGSKYYTLAEGVQSHLYSYQRHF